MADRQPSQPDSVPTDPEGPDPSHIPDPMPADLQRNPDDDQTTEHDDDPMEGEAPSG